MGKHKYTNLFVKIIKADDKIATKQLHINKYVPMLVTRLSRSKSVNPKDETQEH